MNYKVRSKLGFITLVIQGNKTTTHFHFFDKDAPSLGAILIEQDLSQLYQVACLVTEKDGKVVHSFDRNVTDSFKLTQWLKKNKP